MSQTRRAGRGRRPTPTMLLTRLGPLPARLKSAALFRAGGLPRTLLLTGLTGRRSTSSGRPNTRSGHTRRRTRGGDCYRLWCGGSRQRPSTGDSSSRKCRGRNRLPLFAGPRQTGTAWRGLSKKARVHGRELPATAGADPTRNPESLRSWEAP